MHDLIIQPIDLCDLAGTTWDTGMDGKILSYDDCSAGYDCHRQCLKTHLKATKFYVRPGPATHNCGGPGQFLVPLGDVKLALLGILTSQTTFRLLGILIPSFGGKDLQACAGSAKCNPILIWIHYISQKTS